MINPVTDDNSTTFIITDNSSEIVRTKIFLDNLIEPLTILARIKGYKGIDNYILELIKEEVKMFTDTRDNLDDDFQKYMHNKIKGVEVANPWAPKSKEGKEGEDSSELESTTKEEEENEDLK